LFFSLSPPSPPGSPFRAEFRDFLLSPPPLERNGKRRSAPPSPFFGSLFDFPAILHFPFSPVHGLPYEIGIVHSFFPPPLFSQTKHRSYKPPLSFLTPTQESPPPFFSLLFRNIKRNDAPGSFFFFSDSHWGVFFWGCSFFFFFFFFPTKRTSFSPLPSFFLWSRSRLNPLLSAWIEEEIPPSLSPRLKERMIGDGSYSPLSLLHVVVFLSFPPGQKVSPAFPPFFFPPD